MMEPVGAQAGVGTWICEQSISARKSHFSQATDLGGKVTPESPLGPKALEIWVHFIPTVPEAEW